MTPSDQMSTSGSQSQHLPHSPSMQERQTLSKISLRGDDLRGAVPERADPRLHPPALLKFAPKAEVGDLDIHAFVEKDVLEL